MNRYLRVFKNPLYRRKNLIQRYCTESSKDDIKAIDNVPGLSSNVFNVPNEEVGPGASKSSDYKNPEYFCYDKISYFEAEIEMLKYRLPQPSSIQQ